MTMRSLIAAIAETENRIAERYRETEKRIAELRAQQANINQNTDNQEKTESKEQHGKTASHDKIDSGEQHDNHKPEPEGLDGGQEPPSSKEEQQGGTGRDVDIGDIDSTTESGAARMPATEEPCAPTLASDSGDYDFSYNFKISDMSTIMKDKGLRPALGG